MRTFLVGVFLAFCAVASNAGNFVAGFGKVDMVPPAGVRSYVVPERDDLVLTAHPFDNLRLSARAVYIAKDGNVDPIVLVGADLISLCAADADAVRSASYEDAPQGLTRDRILINVSHTHTAPHNCDTSVRVQSTDPNVIAGASPNSAWRLEIIRAMKAAIQNAINDAADSGATSEIRVYRGKFAGGFNRRLGPDAGRYLDATNAEGTAFIGPGYDQTLDVVKITTGPAVKGVLFFYGMHPTSLYKYNFPDPEDPQDALNEDGLPQEHCWQPGHQDYPYGRCGSRVYLHPDYPGFARAWIETKVTVTNGGVPPVAIFFQAAGGDTNPGISPEGYYGTKFLGEALGARVLQLMAGTPKLELLDAASITAHDRLWPAPLQTAAGMHRLGGKNGEPRTLDTPSTAAGVTAPPNSNWFLWANQWCEGASGHGGPNVRCQAKTAGDELRETSFDLELQVLSINNEWTVAALSHEPVGARGVTLRQTLQAQDKIVSVAGYSNREQTYLPTSDNLQADEDCANETPIQCTFKDGPYLGYEGWWAQFMNGLAAPWATLGSTGQLYDLDTEIVHALKMTPKKSVNYAHMREGSTASATSTIPGDGRTPIAAINGDRRGIHWNSDPNTGSGWHGAAMNTTDELLVDFGRPRTIDEIVVVSVQDTVQSPGDPENPPPNYTCQYCLKNFKVMVLDGTRWPKGVWKEVGSEPNNTQYVRRFPFAPMTTTKVKVVATAGPGNYNRIVELEAFGNATVRPNYALAHPRPALAGATATGSSELDPAHPSASGAIDGDRVRWGTVTGKGKGWHSQLLPEGTVCCGTNGESLEIDFHEQRAINQINVYGLRKDYATAPEPTEQDPGECQAEYCLYAFNVEYWNETAWTPVPGAGISGNGQALVPFVLPSLIHTSKIRVNVLNANGRAARIVEVEALGPYDFFSRVVPE